MSDLLSYGATDDKMEVAMVKRKMDEVSQRPKKRQKEEDIWADKIEHSPLMEFRKWKQEGLYLKDWNAEEEDKWQVQDKGKRISQMEFYGRVPEIHSHLGRYTTGSSTQHHGGRCSMMGPPTSSI